MLMNNLFDLSEQICYVQCGFCSTILLVSVPCSSLSMAVTVRCGHCTTFLSVNMMKASFAPLQLLASLGQDDEPKGGALSEEETGPGKTSDRRSTSDNEEDIFRVNPTVNKPPEKRQRAPSAYNRFIKEEIRRLKAQNPNILHKEAFSTAAKNVSGPTFLACTTKRTVACIRMWERRDGTQIRFIWKAMISVKEKPQVIPYGPRHTALKEEEKALTLIL